MAPESKPDSGSDARKNRSGFQIDGIRWEWPKAKGLGLPDLVPHERVVGLLSAVENGVKNGQRAWDGLVQQGIRSSNLCRFQFSNVWREKGRHALQGEDQGKEKREPVGASVLSTSRSSNEGATTASAAYATESVSKEMQQVEAHFRFPEEFRTPEENSSGAVTKEDLGRATWTFLHTLAAQYPDQPTRQQQRDVKELMSIMTRLYPCKTCAEHFKEVVKAYPVKAGSGVELAQWMCQVHNVVNRSLGKPQFPCQRVDARWGELHCDEGACDLDGRLLYR